MSTTEIYAIESNGDVVHRTDLRNSWGGAMAVWTSLSGRHLNGSDPLGGMMDGFKSLFALLKTDKLERWEKLVLLTTCDNAVLRAENFMEVADAFERFHEEYRIANEGKVFHARAQAELLRELHREGDEHGWRGVCWNQTSVNGDSPWYGVREEWDEESDEEEPDPRPYNIDRDEQHWFVMDDLEPTPEAAEASA